MKKAVDRVVDRILSERKEPDPEAIDWGGDPNTPLRDKEKRVGGYLIRSYADLQNVALVDVDLRNANLQNAHLQYANLLGANLQDADLRNANLQFADLRDAHLQRAYLQGANLQGAVLEGANLEGVQWTGANNVDGVIWGDNTPPETNEEGIAL